jgi:hypothetical protein
MQPAGTPPPAVPARRPCAAVARRTTAAAAFGVYLLLELLASLTRAPMAAPAVAQTGSHGRIGREAPFPGAACPCSEPDDDCRAPGGGPADGGGPPVPGVWAAPGTGLDRCRVRKYLPPYIAAGTGALRNSSWPWISEDTYRALADWVVDSPQYGCGFDPGAVACGDVVFVKADYIDDFFAAGGAADSIPAPYILVTAASDLAVPTWGARSALAARPGRLVRWFACQLANDHPPIMSYLPLGINSPGWDAPRPARGGGDKRGPSSTLAPAAAAASEGHFTTAAEIAATLRRKLVAFLDGSLPHKDAVLAAFTIGNNPPEREAAAAGAVGIESHRIWEALLSGAIPVVRAGEYESLLSCLPFVPVRVWQDVTWGELETGAEAILAALDAGVFEFERVFANYQVARIHRAVARAKASCGEG